MLTFVRITFFTRCCVSDDFLSKVQAIYPPITQEDVYVDEKCRSDIDSSKIEVKYLRKAMNVVFSVLCNIDQERK